MKVKIIAEIGINHNGDLNIAKQLIDVASIAGCDAVKFQKRTVKDVYSPDELDKYRESPWGTINRQQKNGLEFGEIEFNEIDSYCKSKKIEWLASAWDIGSQNFLKKYNLKYNKVASAMLSIPEILVEIAKEKRYTFISTGMHEIEEIKFAVNIFKQHECPYELMHCVSSYPCPNEDCNLKMIQTLKKEFNCNVGYSGHEQGLQISLAAAALGATSIERHITLDRAMYGSDQSASLEPNGIIKLVRDIRSIELAIGDGKKKITKQELQIKEKLSNPFWYKK